MDDGKELSAVATVTINVIGNSAPVADINVYGTAEDTVLHVPAELGVLANDYDPEGKALQAHLYTEPLSGDISLALDGSLIYTPTLDFLGMDRFSYRAYDGRKFSPVVPVTITVSDRNDRPVANNDNYSTDEDTALAIAAPGVLANDTDADVLDVLQAIRVDEPAHGTLSMQNDGNFIYTPDEDFFGTDSFTYKVYDGTQYSASNATVNITVDAVNDPPEKVANNVLVVKQDSELTPITNSLLRFLDVETTDASQIEYTLEGGPDHGSLNVDATFTQADIDNGNLLYTHDGTSTISDSLRFTVSDGTDSVGSFLLQHNDCPGWCHHHRN